MVYKLRILCKRIVVRPSHPVACVCCACCVSYCGLILPDGAVLELRPCGQETRLCECLWLSNFRPPTTPCQTAIKLSTPKTHVKGTGSFVNFVSDEDILMTDHVNYRHLHVSGVNREEEGHVASGNGHVYGDRLRFYELNLEHSQAQANFEVSNSSSVDVSQPTACYQYILYLRLCS